MSDKKLLKEFMDQAKNPSVGDGSWSAFFIALGKMYGDNPFLTDLINKTRSKREFFTYKHLSNLIFKAVQYIKISQNDLSYKDFKSAESWTKELEKILSAKKYRTTLKQILLNNHVTTTIFDRYIGPFSIISEYFEDTPVEIADFGCGGNHGLRGLELGEPFSEFEDLTGGRCVLEALKKRINFKRGLAVDKQNPDKKKIRDWRIACRFFPLELNSFDEYILFENRIKNSRKVRFLESSILSLPLDLGVKFDAIIMSLVLYQLTNDQQRLVFSNTKRHLKPGGIIIVQDYCIKNRENPATLDFNVSWHNKNFSFRTFVCSEATDFQFKEILRWFDSRCKLVKEGKDFNFIFRKSQFNASRAAFAHSTS